MLDFLKTAFVTIFVTVDPPGMAPVFIGLTLGMSKEAVNEVALRAAIIAFVILAVFALGGGTLMRVLGITLPAFQIAGGLLLFYTAFEMVFQARGQSKHALAKDAVAVDQIRDLAAFPLAIPLLSGPGSITATILLAEQARGNWMAQAGLLAIIAAVMILCYVTFRLAEQVTHLLGKTGSVVLSRMLGVILAALAAQYVIDGVLAAK